MPTRIVLLGDRDTAFLTHRELDAALRQLPPWAQGGWLGTDTPEARALDGVAGLWVAPGTPYRDADAVDAAIGWALESGTPLLGTCSGFQYVALALAKRLAGIEDAAHAEIDPGARDAMIVPLACSLAGEEREVTCVPGTRLAAICGTEPFAGFHWCNYGLDAGSVSRLEDAGVVISAHAPDAGVEGIELPEHPFFIATLFQPQVGALAGRPVHPLIGAFVAAARERVRVA